MLSEVTTGVRRVHVTTFLFLIKAQQSGRQARILSLEISPEIVNCPHELPHWWTAMYCMPAKFQYSIHFPYLNSVYLLV